MIVYKFVAHHASLAWLYARVQVFSRLERVSLSLLPHTAEAEASTTLLQEMESLASPASPTPIPGAVFIIHHH